MGVRAHDEMLVVGLTGGIAAGKSLVCRMFGDLGAALLDADQIYRDLLHGDEGLMARIAEAVGPEVLRTRPDGESPPGPGIAGLTLDRKALGRRVFADPEARRRLEAVTHPAIAEAARQRIEALRRSPSPPRVLCYEAALLVETGRYRELDRLVVVVADDALRLARLQARDHLDLDEARRRLAAQLPQDQKAALAHYVIDNSGPPDHTRRQVERVYAALLSDGRSQPEIAS